MKNKNFHLWAAGLAASTLLYHLASAQTNDASVLPEIGHDADWSTAGGDYWRMRFSSDYSAVAGGHTSFGGANGNSGAQEANASFTATAPLGNGWFIPMGVTSHNIFLGSVSGAPIPDNINTLALDVGLGYHLNEQWTFSAELGPRLYNVDSIDSQEIGIGGLLRATYKWRPNLTATLGLAVNPDRDVPVLPVAGVRWEISDNWTLNLMFPRSSLDYHVNSKWTLYTGLSGEFTVFRADNDLGDKIGMSQFNNGLGTYRDFHAGVGAEYNLIRGLSASVEGGYSFARQIDYERIGQTVNFDAAPYVKVGLNYRF